MKKICFVVLGIMLATMSYSQSIKSYVITSAGTSIMSSEGAIYLSIGEPMSTELTDGDIMVSQGFLNVTVAGSVSTEDLLTEDVRAYPNPTAASLTLNLPEMDGEYDYQLMDQNGQLITKQRIGSDSEKVDFSTFDSGVYFMKVIKEGKSSKTLKIVKL